MSRKHIALLAALAACATEGGGGSDKLPPFTNGVSTLTGAGSPGFVDGARGTARFNNPTGVAVGPDGKVYVADFNNNRIRVVTSDGTATTLVSQKGFALPFNLAFAGTTLYVTTDSNKAGNHTRGRSGSVWRVDTATGTATELVDSIGMPRGIAVMSDGRLALADYENHVVEILDPSSRTVTPLAGAAGQAGYRDGVGSAALFAEPIGIVQRSDGKLVVAERVNNRLRLVGLDGAVTTLAGSSRAGFADGSMASAMLHTPAALAIDRQGVIYLNDRGNYRVRRISADGTTIDTIAGSGTAGWLDDDDDLSAEFYGMEGIAVSPDGSMVYVADGTGGTSAAYNYVRQAKIQ